MNDDEIEATAARARRCVPQDEAFTRRVLAALPATQAGALARHALRSFALATRVGRRAGRR